MKPEPVAPLALAVLSRLEKSANGDAILGIATLAIAMCALARAEKVTREDLHNCLDAAHAEINPKLDS